MDKNTGDKEQEKDSDDRKSGLAQVFDFAAERIKRGLPSVPAPKCPFSPGFQLISK